MDGMAFRKSAMALLLLAGCGEMGDEEVVTTHTGAIRCYDGNGIPSSSPECPWRGPWSRLTPDNLSADITHTLSPALCARSDGPSFMTISTDSSGRYRTFQWSNVSRAAGWGSYGFKTFVSKPACTFRENEANGQLGFVLAGKAADNKMYASPGIMAPFGIPQQNPVPVSGTPGQFAAVSATTFTTGGEPAVAGRTSGDTLMLLAFMAAGNRTIQAHTRNLPYVGNTWSANPITGPTLPFGWTAHGAPSIDVLPITFRIVIHARNGTTDRLFEVHFFKSGSTMRFSNGLGQPTSSWLMLGNMGTITQNTGPSVVHLVATPDHPGYQTNFFRRNNDIMQTSDAGNPSIAVAPNNAPAFTGDPAVAVGFPFEMASDYMLVARSQTNQLFFLASNPNAPDNGFIGP
jgi:hypothetical protein